MHLQHSWKQQLSCSSSVDEGIVPLIKNSGTRVYLNACIALAHSYVCLGCVCVKIDGGSYQVEQKKT